MSEGPNLEQPIIIKKRRKHAPHPHHGGAWKVAYADFVTAMMAFFLVMWIVGLSQQSKQSMANYFKDPGVFSFKTGKALPDGKSTGRMIQAADALERVTD